MKTLLIERVVNGWIVRPFQCSPDWSRGDAVEMHVYTNIESLQNALPKLLEAHTNTPYVSLIGESS